MALWLRGWTRVVPVILAACFISIALLKTVANAKTSPVPLVLTDSIFTAASNATLGFSGISFIRIPRRYDQSDVMALQAEITGLEYETYDALDALDLDEGRRGFPPSRNPDVIPSLREAACARSHANVWQDMLRSGAQTMLILEGDSTFDVDIRAQSGRLAEAFRELLDSQNLTSYSNARDPWDSSHWDILYFGACYEGPEFADIYVIYDDPGVPSVHYDWPASGVKLETKVGERILRRSGRPICSGAYAVTRRGATRLLLRASIDSSRPVDLMMAEENVKKHIESYTAWPPLIYQWEYKDGLGNLESKNSDIHEYSGSSEFSRETWAIAMFEANVWQIRSLFRDWPFNNWTLAEFGRLWLP